MARTRVDLAGLVVLAFLLLFPSDLLAQQASGISGVVRDAAGTPVAGVTVEVASPALIERVRTAVSDAQGAYQFTNLQPGTYTVTFRAAGFSTLRTEGVELPASFTAAVNGAVKAGNPTETITVTGSVSSVDTRTAATQSIVSAEQSRERASGTGAAQAATSVAQAVVNPTVDVGGAAGSYASTGNGLTVRGKVGVKRLFDGLRIENMEGLGSTSYMPNTATIDQTVLELGGGTAESPAAGGFINYVPVSGSNTFRFRASGLFSNESMQGDNLTQELKDKGLTAVQKVGKIYDITGSAGGPLVKDKLWFFFAPKRWGNQNYAAGIFWNDTQGTGYYTPADGQVATYGPLAGTGGRTVRRADQYEIATSYPVRLTWQMNAKNKFNAFVDWPEAACTCRGLPVTTSPEAVGNYIFGRKGHLWQEGLFQGSWTSPLTAKLLLEAGYSYAQGGFPQVHQQQDPRDDSPNAAYVVGVHDISVQDLGLGFSWNDQITAHSGTRFVPWNTSDRMVQRFAASYVTGAHNIKAGISVEEGFSERYKFVNTIDGGINDGATVTYQFRSASFANPVPSRVIEWATPYLEQARIKADLNVFVQDRWTIKRLTLNYGLRFSYFNAGIPAQHADASPLVPFARDFAAVSCVPCWKDIDPRVGGAYDLFGNGKTAIKGSFGRYVAQQVIVIASANNPFNTSVNSVFRSWNDANGNFAPDCTLTVQSANGECGAISNANFGLANPNATTYSPNVINGWGKRDYIWDSALEVQHQLTRNVTMSGGYYRNSYGNFSVTQNQYFDPVQGRPINSSDYLPYNVIVPTDSRLPAGVSGQPLVGMYDVNAPLFGKVINVIKQANEIGNQSFVNNFIGFAMNGRFAKGIRLGGSLDTGRTTSDRCFVIDSPQDTKFSTQYLNGNSPILGVGAVSAANPTYCHEVIPFSGNLVFRMNGTYPLPRGFAVSGNYSNTPGVMELAVWNVPQSAITGLGRPPSACTTNTSPNCIVGTVPLIEPGTQYEARRNQLDLRLNKTIQLTRKALFTFNVGVYNVLNKNDVISIQTTYGPQWLKPTRVMDARLLQVSARLDF